MSATTLRSRAAAPVTRPPSRPRGVLLSAGLAQLRFVGLGLVLTPVVWYLLLAVFDVSPAVGKTPLDVLTYFTAPPGAAAHRALVAGALAVTLRDTLAGYLAGLLLAFVGAVTFVLAPTSQRLFFPSAVVLRTFPLVVLSPLIVFAVGRGLVAVVVIGVLVVFFDGLVLMSSGLRAVPTATVEVVLAYGGSDLDVLRRAALPTALPAVFSAARLSFPVALTGAMLAEWLATGQGVGALIHQAPTQFLYVQMWAAVAAVTTVSIFLYGLLHWFETVTHATFDQGGAQWT